MPKAKMPDSTPARRGLAPHRGLVFGLQAATLVSTVLTWHLLTATGTLDPFFFGTPLGVLERTWADLTNAETYHHLGITLVETVLAFIIGTASGILFGLWLGRTALASAVFDPFLKAINAVPRVVLAPIFMLWLGLGIASKVALGVTLVFFIVFFNVYQGIREVSPLLVANARLLGGSKGDLMRHVYLPSAMSWVFSSLHSALGFAMVGAVVGEYMGSLAGLGYLIRQAESVFDTNGVFAGLLLLTVLVLAVDSVVSAIERRLLSWQPRHEAVAVWD